MISKFNVKIYFFLKKKKKNKLDNKFYLLKKHMTKNKFIQKEIVINIKKEFILACSIYMSVTLV